MRDEIVQALVFEVLGPRGGINEILPDDPRSEYITGILAPEVGEVAPDAEAEAALPVEEVDGEEDMDEREISAPPFLSPALDPRSLPRSMGVSFVVEHPAASPEFEVCVTWARYRKQGNRWYREPRSFITGAASPASLRNTLWLNAGGRCSSDQAEVSLHVLETSLSGFRTKSRVMDATVRN